MTVVSQRLGHAQVGTTLDIHVHVLPAMDADAVERFACHLYGHDPAPEPRLAGDAPPPGAARAG